MLRPASQSDIPFICTVQARPENLGLMAEDPPEFLTRDLLEPATRILVWEPGAAPEGFAILDTWPDRAPGRWELRRLAVATPGEGRGHAFLVALCRFVFTDLQAHRFHLDVAADNLRARRAYERAGFIEEGLYRRHWKRRTGDWADLALYGMLREDWRARGP